MYLKGNPPMSDRKTPPDFRRELLTKHVGYPNQLSPQHYRSQPLPNFEPMSHAEFLNSLAAGGHSMPSQFGYAVLPGEDPTRSHGWTMFYFGTTQGGSWDGSGMLVRYGGGNPTPQPITGRFALCKHEAVGTGTREQSMRGWHPGYCKLCGLDLTVDSSD